MCGLIGGPGARRETSISASAANAGRSPAIRPAVAQAAARRMVWRFISYAIVSIAKGAGRPVRNALPLILMNPAELAKLDALPLHSRTPVEWARAVLADPIRLLIDHAFLEKKAATNALELLTRWPGDWLPGWVETMTGVARDEAAHLAQVTRILLRRGGRDSRTPVEWAHAVLADPLRLLADHAFLEKKAATNALELLTRWWPPSS